MEKADLLSIKKTVVGILFILLILYVCYVVTYIVPSEYARAMCSFLIAAALWNFLEGRSLKVNSTDSSLYGLLKFLGLRIITAVLIYFYLKFIGFAINISIQKEWKDFTVIDTIAFICLINYFFPRKQKS